jgi:hypothetical protein
MSIADPYLSANRAPLPDFRIVGASRTVVNNPYLMFANSSGYMRSNAPRARVYPRHLVVASTLVIAGTAVSAVVSYLFPGPITGVTLPAFVTLWWMLYRAIVRFDKRENGGRL